MGPDLFGNVCDPRGRRDRNGELPELPSEPGELRIGKAIQNKLSRRTTAVEFVITMRILALTKPCGWADDSHEWADPSVEDMERATGLAARTILATYAALEAPKRGILVRRYPGNKTQRGPLRVALDNLMRAPMVRHEPQKRRCKPRPETPAVEEPLEEMGARSVSLLARDSEAALEQRKTTLAESVTKGDVVQEIQITPAPQPPAETHAATAAAGSTVARTERRLETPAPVERSAPAAQYNAIHAQRSASGALDSAISCPIGLGCPYLLSDLTPSQTETLYRIHKTTAVVVEESAPTPPPTGVDEQAVFKAFKQYCQPDKDGVARAIKTCQQSLADVTTAEIVAAVDAKGPLARKKYNPFGYLLKYVPLADFAGMREELRAEVERRANAELQARREIEATLADPATPEDEKRLLRIALGREALGGASSSTVESRTSTVCSQARSRERKAGNR